jgi:hypothetical protein
LVSASLCKIGDALIDALTVGLELLDYAAGVV